MARKAFRDGAQSLREPFSQHFPRLPLDTADFAPELTPPHAGIVANEIPVPRQCPAAATRDCVPALLIWFVSFQLSYEDLWLCYKSISKGLTMISQV